MDDDEDTGVINVREFMGKWDGSAQSMCESFIEMSGDSEQRFSAISLNLNLPKETVMELSKVCGVDMLWCGDEPLDRKLLLNNIPENTGLQTLDYQKMEIRKQNEKGKRPGFRRHRKSDPYLMPPKLGQTVERSQVPEEDRVSCRDVVLVVQVSKVVGRATSSKVVRDQTFLVRGCMPLTSLRDAIKCVNDFAVAGDVSLNPKDRSQLCAKDICKSGMFFIEKTFYNDMREHDNLDYSKEIREWVRSEGGEELPTADMASTCFLDLQLQLGAQYLYMHQGDCQHIIIFTDLRLIHPTDPQDVRQYPYLLQRAVSKRIVCRACSTHTASYQVFDSAHTPESPCFMCQECHMAFHYDEKGRKIGSFKAYKHVDASMM